MGVVGVDEAARQITIMTGGINPKQDPYFVQYYRVNLDGTGMTALTDADGYHTAVFSPDNKYFVDTWSRVDLAPVSVLKRASDGQQVLELERGDLTAARPPRAGARRKRSSRRAATARRTSTASSSGRRASIRRAGIR